MRKNRYEMEFPQGQPRVSAITHVIEPVLPGTHAVMTVGGVRSDTRIYAHRLDDSTGTKPGGKPKLTGAAIPLKIVKREGECLTVDIPAKLTGVMAFSLEREFDPENAWIVNRPRLDWGIFSSARIGQPFRLIGRNFVGCDHYPTVDPRHPVSFAGFHRNQTTLLARLVGADRFAVMPVQKSSSYEIHFKVPERLAPGAYEFFAHNGKGGALGWAEPLKIIVKRAEVWPSRVFKVDPYIQKAKGGVDAGIAAALKAIRANGGGVLQFARGSYEIDKTIVVPPQTVIRGMGKSLTRIAAPTHSGPRGPLAMITGDRDFVVEDLHLNSIYAGLQIAAPTCLPKTLEEALHTPMTEKRARNITVRRCYLAQHPNNARYRRGDVDGGKYRDFVDRFNLQGSQVPGYDGFVAIQIRGDDLLIEDNLIWGGGSCICTMGAQHAWIAHNDCRVGPAGHGIEIVGRLQWKTDPNGKNLGATIAGNYSRNILVEDNTIVGHDDSARDGFYVLRGAENVHVARNRIESIVPSDDGEGLGYHLWSAVWDRSGVKMTGPTQAEIVDPLGELADEILEEACLYILEGRGVGQVRKILKREGDRIEIDSPWIVEPDSTSRVAFQGPTPYNRVNIVDNCVEKTGINYIVWGNSRDVILDGNRSADAAGEVVFSIRIKADQRVYGGAAYTSILNSRVRQCWGSGGIGNFINLADDSQETGFDFLGLVIRNNYLTDNSPIYFMNKHKKAGGIYEADYGGIVIENNLIEECDQALQIQKGSRLTLRNNRFRKVGAKIVEFDWTPLTSRR